MSKYSPQCISTSGDTTLILILKYEKLTGATAFTIMYMYIICTAIQHYMYTAYMYMWCTIYSSLHVHVYPITVEHVHVNYWFIYQNHTTYNKIIHVNAWACNINHIYSCIHNIWSPHFPQCLFV